MIHINERRNNVWLTIFANITDLRMPSNLAEKSAVLRFLSGRQRGKVEALESKTLFLNASAPDQLSVAPPDDHAVTNCVAILHRMGGTYELEVPVGGKIWVNGEKETASQLLQDGDLIEFGPSEPLVRFRLFPRGSSPAKSLKEALSDSVENARKTGDTRLGATGRFITGFLGDLATETTALFRLWTLLIIVLLVLIVVVLMLQNYHFQQSLVQESVRIESIAKILDERSGKELNRKDFEIAREEIEEALSQALLRVENLEGKSADMESMLETVSRSIVFVQGEYGFRDQDSGKFLHYVVSPTGLYFFSLDKIGDKVAVPYSGTAFQISNRGWLLTNKHLTNPWLMTGSEPPSTKFSLQPEILRVRVFWPPGEMWSVVKSIATSDDTDLAILEPERLPEHSGPLLIENRVPRPGEEVLLLGYPLGLSGITARTSNNWAETNEQLDQMGFWPLADHLAAKGLITPLVSRGIVSQITNQYIAYDAETAVGGSGGPVLTLDGKVLAINTATFGNYGGSNLGVPGKNITRFLKQVE